ncbi:hypothetical protein SAMN05444358_1231 [Ruegeria halocynthiae]|uniref:Uncharacterized protein n=1 Tax=Ruegeria halocynthiae TaxID=985054 RepID=A0A1H3G3L2_9RHOB|nr:hypothetical protein SAMN05444358_1231 [Ruegeria halocynthiae]
MFFFIPLVASCHLLSITPIFVLISDLPSLALAMNLQQWEERHNGEDHFLIFVWIGTNGSIQSWCVGGPKQTFGKLTDVAPQHSETLTPVDGMSSGAVKVDSLIE